MYLPMLVYLLTRLNRWPYLLHLNWKENFIILIASIRYIWRLHSKKILLFAVEDILHQIPSIVTWKNIALDTYKFFNCVDRNLSFQPQVYNIAQSARTCSQAECELSSKFLIVTSSSKITQNLHTPFLGHALYHISMALPSQSCIKQFFNT